MDTQKQFEGWALIELYGHAKEIGYVTTQYFGTACMFQVDVPKLDEREYVLESPQYVDGYFVPAGSTVKRAGTTGRSRLLGVGSIYSMNPCDQQTAMSALERSTSRELKLVSLAEGKQLLPGEPGEEEEFDGEDRPYGPDDDL